MGTQKRKKWKIISCVIGVLLVTGAISTGCTTTNHEPFFSDDSAQLLVVARLTELAKTPQAREYVGLLFPSAALGDFVEWHDKLGGWKYVIDYWPSEASEAFQSMPWFSGNFDKHFAYFNRPTWVIYEDGSIIPLGGALLVEADIETLNTQPFLL